MAVSSCVVAIRGGYRQEVGSELREVPSLCVVCSEATIMLLSPGPTAETIQPRTILPSS